MICKKAVKKISCILVLALVVLGWRLPAPVSAQGPGAVIAASVEYALPYPGLLPDSPFYFLKVLRDRAFLFVLRDPVQKGFYQLLLADKRLAAGEVLVNNNKKELGAVTAGQAEEFFAGAVETLLANKTKPKSEELAARLTVAGGKHGEVLGKLLARVSGKDFERMQGAYQTAQKSRERVTEVLLKK
jgi:hypothetical protein